MSKTRLEKSHDVTTMFSTERMTFTSTCSCGDSWVHAKESTQDERDDLSRQHAKYAERVRMRQD